MMTMMISSWKFPEFSTGYKLTSVCRIECSTVYLLQKWNTTTYFPTFEKCASFGKQIVSFVVWMDCVCVYVDKIKSKQMKRERECVGKKVKGKKAKWKDHIDLTRSLRQLFSNVYGSLRMHTFYNSIAFEESNRNHLNKFKAKPILPQVAALAAQKMAIFGI